LSPARAQHIVRTAQSLYTFWNTGQEPYLTRVEDHDFLDKHAATGAGSGPGRPADRRGGVLNAIDIQHLGNGATITEDWHLEDNLAFLQQADLVTGRRHS